MSAAIAESSRVLSSEEIAAYNRDGFIVARKLYDPETMLQWKAVLKGVLEEEKASGKLDARGLAASGVRVWARDRLHPTLLEAMRDQQVTPILRQVVGPNVEFLSGKAVFKDNATSFSSPWHQDWFYWEGSTKTSVWIALDDATPENGCLKFVPGSHRRIFPKKVVGEAFGNRIDEKDLEGWPVTSVPVQRGDCVFFHDQAVHSSHPNRTGADRWSFISTYREASVKDASGLSQNLWKWPLIVCGTSVNGGSA
ncbi:MAG: phytanoyl-CoA dioxygenase family protein [Planctomycetes bacterium]|nr:phytanoyl-CoA dioxygenase family protein [Planctomycetota bacterium]